MPTTALGCPFPGQPTVLAIFAGNSGSRPPFLPPRRRDLSFLAHEVSIQRPKEYQCCLLRLSRLSIDESVISFVALHPRGLFYCYSSIGNQFCSQSRPKLFSCLSVRLQVPFFWTLKRKGRKKRAPDDLPYGSPALLMISGAPSTGGPSPAMEAPRPCGAPTGLCLQSLRCSAASNGFGSAALIPCVPPSIAVP